MIEKLLYVCNFKNTKMDLHFNKISLFLIQNIDTIHISEEKKNVNEIRRCVTRQSIKNNKRKNNRHYLSSVLNCKLG